MGYYEILRDADRRAAEREARQHGKHSAARIARAKKRYEETQRYTKQGIKWTKRRAAIAAFYHAGHTLRETGIRFGITGERVRQVLAKVTKRKR